MYSTLMVYLEPERDNARLLKVTADLARRFGAGVVGIAASQPLQIVYGQGVLSGDIVELDRTEVKRELQALEENFRAAMQAAGIRQVEWRAHVGVDSLPEYVTREARCADLIVTEASHGGSLLGDDRSVHPSDLVMQAGRPVLIVPPGVTELALRNVLIGWKDTREARRAVTDALPLLAQAASVKVVEIANGEDLSGVRARLADVVAWLGRHGVKAESVVESAMSETGRLDAVINHHDPDLVVAGAYGHSRFREWALGGVTYDLLLRSERCTLVSH
jgi:nucleotide-binding universal stress UspA family protein